MIPKIIHYCWFGRNEYPEAVKQCIKSWKKNCPDYSIVEWNEENFDIDSCTYVKEAYDAGKWAFVSDYVRLWALINYGGIYLDTDVELLRPIDDFLGYNAFLGFESRDSVGTAVIGCEKQHPFFERFLNKYNKKHFLINGIPNTKTNVTTITNMLLEKGLIKNGKKQIVCDCTVFPQNVFYPNNAWIILNRYRRGSFSVHHFLGSWTEDNSTQIIASKKKKIRTYLVRALRNVIGTARVENISNIIKR